MVRAGRKRQPDEAGWWLASDGRWYPPERSADPEHAPRVCEYRWAKDEHGRQLLRDDTGRLVATAGDGVYVLADQSTVKVELSWWAAGVKFFDAETNALRAIYRHGAAGMWSIPTRAPRKVGRLAFGDDGEWSAWRRVWSKDDVVEFRHGGDVVGWVQFHDLARVEGPVLVLRQSAAHADGLVPLVLLEVAPRVVDSGGVP